MEIPQLASLTTIFYR